MLLSLLLVAGAAKAAPADVTTAPSRLVMLTASAAHLCRISTYPPELQVPELRAFLRRLDADFPGNTDWLRSNRTFEGAVTLANLLDEDCTGLTASPERFMEVATPYLQ